MFGILKFRIIFDLQSHITRKMTFMSFHPLQAFRTGRQGSDGGAKTTEMEIIRATKTAERAGAYYVRIQAMARKHQIPLDVEFDEHDTPDTKYIVIVDDYLPIATCRLYAIDTTRVMLGRIVVLPEYRGQGIGTLVVKEAEKWAKELCFKTAVLESRDNKIRFYETMGYVADCSQKIVGETFTCYRMEKRLK